MSSHPWRTAAIVVSSVLLGLGVGLEIEPSSSVSGLMLAIIGAVSLGLVLATGALDPDLSEATLDATAWTEFRRELRRARRHGRSLTLMRIPRAPAGPGTRDVDLGAVSRRIGSRLRLVDRTWVDGDSVYVMLPESDHDAASIVVDRLGEAAPAGGLAPVRVATFPVDGLTSGAILAAVHDTAIAGVAVAVRPSHEEGFNADDTLAVGETAIPR